VSSRDQVGVWRWVNGRNTEGEHDTEIEPLSNLAGGSQDELVTGSRNQTVEVVITQVGGVVIKRDRYTRRRYLVDSRMTTLLLITGLGGLKSHVIRRVVWKYGLVGGWFTVQNVVVLLIIRVCGAALTFRLPVEIERRPRGG
jgi:hypothetical protein